MSNNASNNMSSVNNNMNDSLVSSSTTTGCKHYDAANAGTDAKRHSKDAEKFDANVEKHSERAEDGGSDPISALATIGAGGIIDAANASGTPLSVPLPFQNRIVLIEDTRIAGTTHIDNIDAIAETLETGTRLRFEREPNNLADAWAIKVFAQDMRIGYVPADCNEILARLMDGGKPLSGTFIGKEKIGHWNKLHMEVSLDD